MDKINESIIFGGLDDIKTTFDTITKHIGGQPINIRRRVGGKTAYSIRDYDINHQLIVDSNDMRKDKNGGGRKSKAKIKKSVPSCSILKPIKIQLLSDREKSINKELGILFNINTKGDMKQVCESLRKLYHQSTNNFISDVVEKFKLSHVICDALRNLHEALVLQYLHIAMLYMKICPSCADMTNIKSYPSNYTNELIKFKTIKFFDKSMMIASDNIKGFCPFEPKVRIEQLLSFPIKKLLDKLTNTPSITIVQVNTPVTIINKKSNHERIKNIPVELPPVMTNITSQSIWYSKHIINRWKQLKPIIEHKEQEYINISKRINAVANFLQLNLTKIEYNY